VKIEMDRTCVDRGWNLVVSGECCGRMQAATQNILVHFTNNSDSALTRSEVNLDGGAGRITNHRCRRSRSTSQSTSRQSRGVLGTRSSTSLQARPDRPDDVDALRQP
jgi:hypothetical protein